MVAREVKALANQTAQATEEIAARSARMQSGDRTRRCEAIRASAATIGKVNEIATAIAAAVEEQGAATQEITRNVQEAAQRHRPGVAATSPAWTMRQARPAAAGQPGAGFGRAARPAGGEPARRRRHASSADPRRLSRPARRWQSRAPRRRPHQDIARAPAIRVRQPSSSIAAAEPFKLILLSFVWPQPSAPPPQRAFAISAPPRPWTLSSWLFPCWRRCLTDSGFRLRRLYCLLDGRHKQSAPFCPRFGDGTGHRRRK